MGIEVKLRNDIEVEITQTKSGQILIRGDKENQVQLRDPYFKNGSVIFPDGSEGRVRMKNIKTGGSAYINVYDFRKKANSDRLPSANIVGLRQQGQRINLNKNNFKWTAAKDPNAHNWTGIYVKSITYAENLGE